MKNMHNRFYLPLRNHCCKPLTAMVSASLRSSESVRTSHSPVNYLPIVKDKRLDSSLGQTRPENELLQGVPPLEDIALDQPESIIADRLIGDADGDGDLDRMDLRDIFRNRGTRSSGADDPRDLNGNGRIDIGDARMLFRQLRGNRDHRAPDLMAVLANDTIFDGGTNSDRITSDATISGTVTDSFLIANFGN